MATVTQRLIAAEDLQGGQGTFSGIQSDGTAQTLTKYGAISRVINLLDYVSFADSDNTTGINSALADASPINTDGTYKTSAALSTNEAWVYSGLVWAPAGTYFASNIKIPTGVQFVGAGRGGFGLEKKYAVTRFQQLESAKATDFVTFYDDEDVDDRMGHIVIANMFFLGPRSGDNDSGAFQGTAANNGIRFYGENDSQDVDITETTVLNNIAVRGFGNNAIQCTGGFSGLRLQDIVIHLCGGYAIELAAETTTTAYNGFRASMVRMNACTNGGIYVHDLAKWNGTPSGCMTFSSIYYEMGANTAYNTSEAGSPYNANPGDPVGKHAMIFEDCVDTPVVIDGISVAASGPGVETGGVASPYQWAPLAAIKIQDSAGTGKSPILHVSGVSMRRMASQDEGRWAPGFALIDDSNGVTIGPWTNGADELGTDALKTAVGGGADVKMIITLPSGHGVVAGDRVAVHGARDFDDINPNGVWDVTDDDTTDITVQTDQTATAGDVAGGGDWIELAWVMDRDEGADGVDFVPRDVTNFIYGAAHKVAFINQYGDAGSQFLFGNGVYRPDSGATYRPDVQISGRVPALSFVETDAAADNRHWVLYASGGEMRLAVLDDQGTEETTPGVAFERTDGDSIGIVVDGYVALTEGITAPGTTAGEAKIYVDTSDGDLKVKFGDGTVETIVVGP